MLSLHTSTTCSHDIHARHALTTYMHDILSRHTSTTYFHEMLPRHASGGWTDQLPPWAGMGRDRGLQSWGERLSKKAKKKGRVRRWEVTGVQRQTLMRGLDFYSEVIGRPPVKTGVPPGTVHAKKKPKKFRYGGGFRKHQIQLVEASPEQTIDCVSVFVFVLYVFYCLHLKPEVPQGSDAEVAVLKTLLSDYCRVQLLRSMKTRFQVFPRHVSTTYIHDLHTPTPHVSRGGPIKLLSSTMLKTYTTGLGLDPMTKRLGSPV